MKELKRNIKIMLAVFIGAFVFLVAYFSYAIYFYGGRWFESSYNVRIQSEKKKVVSGDILDRNGVVLATTKIDKNGEPYRVYNKNGRASAHVVGYDNAKLGRSGSEAFFVRYLLGFNNNIIERIYQTVFLPQRRGNNAVLTIDFRLQESAARALGDRRGAVVLLNPKTGEVLTMVSKPDYDPNHLEAIEKYREDEELGILRNRATQSNKNLYPPGSTFKIVTAASALRYIDNIEERKFDCEGYVILNGSRINDYNGESHGSIDLKQAMTVSCNSTFSKLGVELGKNKLKKTAEDFGFNEDFLFSDIRLRASNFEPPVKKQEDELARDSIGQGRDTATPLHMAMVAGSIANKGVMMEPKLLKAVKNIRGYEFKRLKPQVFRRPVSETVASRIKDMMLDVVSKGTGKSAQIKGVKIAGKTGTAEVAGEKGKEAPKPHAWFVGFVDDEKHPLAVAVIVENAGTGGTVAAPVAKKVLQEAIRLGY